MSASKCHTRMDARVCDERPCDIQCYIVLVLNYIPATLSIPVYCSALIACYRLRKELSRSFTATVISAGVADLCHVCHLLFTTFYPEIFFCRLWIEAGPLLPLLIRMSSWYLYYAQVTGVLLIGLNRFVATVAPKNYERFWSKAKIIATIVFQWSWPIAWAIPMMLSDEFHSDYYTYTLAKSNTSLIGILSPLFVCEQTQKWYRLLSNVLEFGVFLPSILCMYVCMYIALRRRRAYISNTTSIAANSAQAIAARRLSHKLTLMGCAICFCYVAMLLMMVPLYTLDKTLPLVPMMSVYRCSSLFFSVVSSYLLLWMSGKVRRRVLNMWHLSVIRRQLGMTSTALPPPQPHGDSSSQRMTAYRAWKTVRGLLRFRNANGINKKNKDNNLVVAHISVT